MHIFTLLLLVAVVYLIYRMQQSKPSFAKTHNPDSLPEIKEAIMKIASDLDSIKKDVEKLKRSQSEDATFDVKK